MDQRAKAAMNQIKTEADLDLRRDIHATGREQLSRYAPATFVGKPVDEFPKGLQDLRLL
jgi:hypothetical protein